jgi:hypothetical protein
MNPGNSTEQSNCEMPDDAEIDEALEESFPASDPLPWTLGVEPHCNPAETNSERDRAKSDPEPRPNVKKRAPWFRNQSISRLDRIAPRLPVSPNFTFRD